LDFAGDASVVNIDGWDTGFSVLGRKEVLFEFDLFRHS